MPAGGSKVVGSFFQKFIQCINVGLDIFCLHFIDGEDCSGGWGSAALLAEVVLGQGHALWNAKDDEGIFNHYTVIYRFPLWAMVKPGPWSPSSCCA